jgi:3-hydroxyisobutyrate dehydrogenase
MTIVGFIGLGNMGSVLASNLVEAGHEVTTHDVAGARRNPAGARFADDVPEVARNADVVVFSLPDGTASERVAEEIAGTQNCRTTHIIDTSTIGVEASRKIESLLASADIGYIDAPVSGGVAGARARTLLVMYAGSEAAREGGGIDAVLGGLSDRRESVGDRAGMAQALKLVNNFLAASALVATSEAIAFGISVGLDMSTMLGVLNQSTGQSVATSDKFPTHVLSERYAAGFTNTLMSKDLGLYLQAVDAGHETRVLSPRTVSVWREFAEAEPGADFTRIYPFIRGQSG